MVAQAKIVVVKSEVEKPIVAVASPIIKPFEVGVGLAEEFALHLLKFTYSEYEVAGSYLVPEGFTYLANAEGNLFSCGSLDILKVYEYTLCRFRSQIDLALRVLCYALERLKHKVKLTDIGKVL